MSIFFKDDHGTIEGTVESGRGHQVNIDVWIQGKGHGRRLLTWFLEQARLLGANRITLDVAPYAGERERAFFRRMGFRPTAIPDHLEKRLK